MAELTHGYDQQHVDELEGVFEDGFLSGGGTDSLEWMLRGIRLDRADVLDFGCGLGGGATALAVRYPLRSVVGVDIEPHLIAAATARSVRFNVRERASFVQVTPSGALPFRDGSFDVVYSKESIIHIRGKGALFAEFRRVLRPAGALVILDWCGNGADASQELDRFMRLDGLNFWLAPPEEYKASVEAAGLCVVRAEDRTAVALAETRECIATVTRCEGALKQRLGRMRWDSYVESWRLQERLFEASEIRVVAFTAERRVESEPPA